jgi:4-amino-4-deoxy-L-arabinose transferase-like glycosyltransferase
VVTIAGVLFAIELLVSARYGYHRDELYFIAIGGHPAFGYVDQPPLVPLLDHWLNVVGAGSLFVLRLPAALAVAATVVLTSLMARELGATPPAQALAAAFWAVAAFNVSVGHLSTTSVYDLLMWTCLSWLVLRAARSGGPWWLLTGVVAGVAFEVKSLVAALLCVMALSLLVTGHARLFRSAWFWVAVGAGAVLLAPNLLWQAHHGWPQVRMSSSIAGGSSGSSQTRALFFPY